MKTEEINKLQPLIDSRQAAELLGISWRQAQRMAAAGLLPAVKVGKLWRFPTARLLASVGLGE